MSTATEIESITEFKKQVTCPECGSVRMNTPSGSVCPNGHGRLHPRVSESARTRLRKWKENCHLPEAKPAFQFTNIWTLEGEDGYFKRVTRYDAGLADNAKKVRVGERVRFCIPYTSKMIEAAEKRAEVEAASKANV